MEKKKLKLSVTSTSRKTISSIEQAKSKSKNSVIIERRNSRYPKKQFFQKNNRNNENTKNQNFTSVKKNYNNLTPNISSDFEKRKLCLLYTSPSPRDDR